MAVIKLLKATWNFICLQFRRLKGVFVKDSELSQKRELNFTSFKWLAISAVVIFITLILLLPNSAPIEFSEKLKSDSDTNNRNTSSASNAQKRTDANALWSDGQSSRGSRNSGGTQVNYNSSMILGQKNGNSKTQLNPGVQLALRVIDKFIVSQEAVPMMAEVITDFVTDSGLRLPAGSIFYGEATFQKGADRATVQFRQISLPTGEIRKISSLALGKDGQPGVPGRTYSDGMKNTGGEILTTFVGGLASGSMQTNVFGQTQGGLSNGLLNAVSETAKNRAQGYGEKLKAEREWIEVTAGTECNAVINESFNLQSGGDQ